MLKWFLIHTTELSIIAVKGFVDSGHFLVFGWQEGISQAWFVLTDFSNSVFWDGVSEVHIN